MRNSLIIQNQTHIAMKAQWNDEEEQYEMRISPYFEKRLDVETRDVPILRFDPILVPKEKPSQRNIANQDRDNKFADCAEYLWEILAEDPVLQNMMNEYIDSDDESPDEEDLEAFEEEMKLRIARFMYDYEEQKSMERARNE